MIDSIIGKFATDDPPQFSLITYLAGLQYHDFIVSYENISVIFVSSQL